MAHIAVVVLTLNEERNLPYALSSAGWADSLWVVDSGSTDRTREVAESVGANWLLVDFHDYSSQRNKALAALPEKVDWVYFLDADETVPGTLAAEIRSTIDDNPPHAGYYLKWRLIWMGTWVRRGYYPTYVLRLFRRSAGECDSRGVNEHFRVTGTTGFLKNDFIHEDHNGISRWISKHNRYAALEAEAFLRRRSTDLRLSWSSSQAERTAWLRERIWNRLPLLVRPFLYFTYRVVVRGGILDGWRALIYHFLQAFWFFVLIDLNILEMRSSKEGPSVTR